jgi:hypothetical protein
VSTTLDSLQAGSTAYKYVAAIEGCKYLLTDGSTSAALTAWAGTDWTLAIGGLQVELKCEQRLNPDKPFGSGGSCTLTVIPDVDDTFGIYTSKRTAGERTYLRANLDHNDTTVNVKSAVSWPSSGEFHIGTECVAYATKALQAFTDCTRGMYAVGQTSAGGRFSHYHRVEQDANGVKIEAAVTENPRHWVGRMVEVYMHREVGGVLDTKDEAVKIFAGRIDALADDPNHFGKVIHCAHVLDIIRDTTIGAAQWNGIGKDGVYLSAGMVFGWSDSVTTFGSTLSETAIDLAVVSTPPLGASHATTPQIAAGWYTHTDLCSQLTAWLAKQKAEGNLYGTYAVELQPLGGEQRIKVKWTLAGLLVAWTFEPPAVVAKFFGYPDPTFGYSGLGKSGAHEYPDSAPGRLSILMNGDEASRVRVETRSGTLADQANDLPASVEALVDDDEAWGVFVLGESTTVIARINDPGTADAYLDKIQPFLKNSAGALSGFITGNVSISFNVDSTGDVSIRQIYVFESSLKNILMRLVHSTGTETFNHPTRDTYPLGAGAGIPWSWAGTLLSATIDDIPGSTGTLAVVIDKPIRLSDLLGSDLLMRWAYLYWFDGVLRMGAWKWPSAVSATYELDEENKAEPSDNATNQRSAASEHREWHKPITRIRYNRSIANLGSDEYSGKVAFVDSAAIDDAGGDGAVRMISLRNTYSEFAGTGASLESLLPGYLAMMPLISRPANAITRGLAFDYFFRLHVGEVVLFSDEFARDPVTGERGISGRPAIVTRLNFSPGGWQAGSDRATNILGEVDLYFTDQDTERASVAYVPSADIDDTASGSGFDAGYNSSVPSLRCYAHRYSESSEAVDASHIAAGDKVIIIERDPVNPDSPISWERTVLSVSSNDIALTATLSAPAWDNTKKYRVLFGTWANATLTQQAKTYQADVDDALIDDEAQPFLYGGNGPDGTYTANTSTEIEIVPSMAYADGFGRDTGYDAALIRLADNFADYKSAIQAPMLWSTEVSNTTVTGSDYMLADCRPMFLTREYLTNAVFRYVSIAPWARSTDGTSTKIRVSLCTGRPTGTSLTNVTRTGLVASYEWTGITSTTAAIQTAQDFLARVKDSNGQCFIVVELGYKCASWGLARFREGARQAVA